MWNRAGLHKLQKKNNNKPRSHLKIPGARKVTGSKFHTQDPQILGATAQKFVAMATWCAWNLCIPADRLPAFFYMLNLA